MHKRGEKGKCSHHIMKPLEVGRDQISRKLEVMFTTRGDIFVDPSDEDVVQREGVTKCF